MKTKRTIKALVLALFMLMLFAVPAHAAKAKLNKTKLTLSVGKTYQLVVKNTTKNVKWKSIKKDVVAVTQNGKIKAKKAGKTRVIATVGSKKLTCTVTVKAKKSSGSGSSSSSSRSLGTVYWTPSGTVYHLSRNCSTLSRSRTVYSGSVSASGKPRACKVCG